MNKSQNKSKTSKPPGDILRKMWRVYVSTVMLEGVFLVFGLSGITIFINYYLISRGGDGLGLFIIMFGLIIAYLAVIGIMRPFSLWRKAGRFPLSKDIPDTLKIVIPVFKDGKHTPEEMKTILETNSLFSFLDKRRFWRNLVVFILGVFATIAIYLI